MKRANYGKITLGKAIELYFKSATKWLALFLFLSGNSITQAQNIDNRSASFNLKSSFFQENFSQETRSNKYTLIGKLVGKELNGSSKRFNISGNNILLEIKAEEQEEQEEEIIPTVEQPVEVVETRNSRSRGGGSISYNIRNIKKNGKINTARYNSRLHNTILAKEDTKQFLSAAEKEVAKEKVRKEIITKPLPIKDKVKKENKQKFENKVQQKITTKPILVIKKKYKTQKQRVIKQKEIKQKVVKKEVINKRKLIIKKKLQTEISNNISQLSGKSSIEFLSSALKKETSQENIEPAKESENPEKSIIKSKEIKKCKIETMQDAVSIKAVFKVIVNTIGQEKCNDGKLKTSFEISLKIVWGIILNFWKI
jgi:hypothetical protein